MDTKKSVISFEKFDEHAREEELTVDT